MKAIIKEMFEHKTWAVVGATQNQSKFGYKIFSKLMQCHYAVTPVNPVYDQVDGVKTASSLSETHGVTVVNVVVGPEKTYDLLDEIKEKGIEYVWFQPGTYDDRIIQKADDLGLKSVYGYCVLVELGDLPFCPI